MLHLAGGIAFGVDVGNFFQLECAFERDRIVDAAAEEEKVLRPRVLLGELLARFFARQNLLQLAGQAREFVHFGFAIAPE